MGKIGGSNPPGTNGGMSNDELRMTKETRNPNAEQAAATRGKSMGSQRLPSGFVIGHSFVIRA